MTTPQIFLAYYRGNYVEAEQLHDELLEAGYSVWWDHDILPGQDWKFEIRNAMQDCSVYLLCLSKEGVKRKKSGIYLEIFDAISIYRECKPGEISLIPVRFSECKIPPIEIDGTRTLNRLQCVDLFPPEKRDQSLERLLVALRKHFPTSQKSDFISTPSVSELPDKGGVEDNLADTKTVVALEITVRGNFDKFSDEDLRWLARSFEKLFSIEEIITMKRRPGNIMVTVKLPPAQAEILRQEIKTEKFEYSVEDARLIESHILLEDSSTLQAEATLTIEKKRTIALLGEQTVPIPARSIHTCRFSPEHIEDTLERYNLLSAAETCPHIRMVQVGGIIFYAVMDTNCHTPQPDLQNNECDKEPSQLIRLIVKKDFRSRSNIPVKITAILKSHKPHLLAFSDGVLDESTNVLDLTNKPLCVGPIYTKVGRSNQDIINIRVRSFPQHELERIPVEIEVTVWKEHPYVAYQRKRIILSVAVPPVAAPSDVVP